MVEPRHFDDVAGGQMRAAASSGWLVQPTSSAAPWNTMRTVREGVSGPVLSIVPFGDGEGAVGGCMQTKSVWTGPAESLADPVVRR